MKLFDCYGCQLASEGMIVCSVSRLSMFTSSQHAHKISKIVARNCMAG